MDEELGWWKLGRKTDLAFFAGVALVLGFSYDVLRKP